MPEDVTIINNGGEVALGVVTNLVVSGYGKYGSDRGSLFSPGGDLQISGSLVTYQNMYGRGGIFAGDIAGSNYTHGVFLKGGIPTGDAIIDGLGVDILVLGSGFFKGTMAFTAMQPGNFMEVGMPIRSDERISAGFNVASFEPGTALAIVGSGVISGPLLCAPRQDFPNDYAVFDMPIYLAATPLSPGSILLNTARVLTSGEIARGGSHQLDAQTAVVGIDGSDIRNPVYQYAVPSGQLGTRGGIEIEWYGHYLNNTGSPHSLSVMIPYGAQTWLTGTVSGIASHAAPRSWSGRVRVNAAGSTTAQRALLTYDLAPPNTTSGVASVDTGTLGVMVTNPYVAVHTNAPPQTLSVELQHDSSDPQLRAFVHSVTTRKL